MVHWYRLLLLGTFTDGIGGVGVGIGSDDACVSASEVVVTSTIAAKGPALPPGSVMAEALPLPPATLLPALTRGLY